MSKRINQLTGSIGNLLSTDRLAIDRLNIGGNFTTFHITGTQIINAVLAQIPDSIYTSGSGLFSIQAINTSTTNATGPYSYASGENTLAAGQHSFVHGKNSQANGHRSVVFGENIIGNNDDTVYIPNLELQGSVLAKYTEQPDTQPGFDDLTLVTKKWVEDNVSIDTQKYNKILFVDVFYGDNPTAEISNPLLPYQSITAAINDATSGDLIIVRPGSYNDTCTLKNEVDLYLHQQVIITGRILAVSVKSNIYGYGSLIRNLTTSDAIAVGGTDSIVNIHLQELSSLGTVVYIDGNNKLYLTCNNFTWSTINYGITLRGDGSYVNVDVKDTFYCGTNLSYSGSGIDVRGTNTNIDFKADKVIVGNSSNTSAGTFLTTITGNPTGDINIKIKSLISLYDNASANSSGIFNRSTQQNMNIEIDYIYSPMRTIYNMGGTGNVTIKNGKIVSRRIPMNITITGKTVIKNCILIRDVTEDENMVLQLPITGSITQVELINTKLIKISDLAYSNTDAIVIIKNNDSSIMMLKNCEIIGIDVPNGTLAIESNTLGNGEIYFNNTRSNLNIGSTITDTSISGGFIGNDTNLTSFE